MIHRIISPKPPASSDSGDFEQEREQLHRQMMSSVSHDLKTPLASIIGALEVSQRMKDQLSTEKMQTLVSVALQEAYRLDAFITNILDMARLENGMVTPKRENTELGALLRDCLMRMDNRLRGSKVNLHPAMQVEVQTDAVLLTRAICQVLDNAVKYGGTPATLDIEYGKEDTLTAFIRIQDNGRGIPEDQTEAIFSKYTRAVKEDQQNAGTGLGLAIGRAIMNLLGGSIIASNARDGALFTLRFPLHP